MYKEANTKIPPSTKDTESETPKNSADATATTIIASAWAKMTAMLSTYFNVTDTAMPLMAPRKMTRQTQLV